MKTTKKFGIGLILLGIIGVTISFIIGALSGKQADTRLVQILGAEISILPTLAGLWILLSDPIDRTQNKKPFYGFIDRVLNLPVFIWVLAGFFAVYIFYYIWPVFFNDALEIAYPVNFLPHINPIGNDLRVLMYHTKGLFFENQSPYSVHFYPPLTFVAFAPLLLSDNYPLIYKSFTLINIVCYVLLAILAAKMTHAKNTSVLTLLFITGLFSYGFQFELERGQYNLIAFLLCMWSIYLFHNRPRYRLFAYLLISISIQLKLYPAIFIFLFIENWKDWKKNLLRFAGIGLFNFLLLFVMGYRIFLDFINMVSIQLLEPRWISIVNHSIKSFVEMFMRDGFNLFTPDVMDIARQYSSLLSTLFLVAFFAALLIAIFIPILKKDEGIDSFLLMTCMIGALIIPISNDYKLSLLFPPMAIFLCNIPVMKKKGYQFTSIVLILSISTAYFFTLVPYTYKPYFLNNSFPALFLILILLTVLNIVRFLDFKANNAIS